MVKGWQGWPLSARTVIFFGIVGGLMLFVFSSRITSVSFCGTKFSIPEGCDANSRQQLECSDCNMSWSYVDGDMLEYLSEQAAKEIIQHNYPSTKENIVCYLMGTKVSAYKIVSRKNHYNENTIIAYGKVNEHSVLVRLSAPHDLVENENIPNAARQFLSFDQTK